MAGRLPHWLFRGLLDVHSRCSPHGPLIPLKGPFLRVLQVIRRLLTRPECFRLEREFAGPDSHRGGKCTLSRHTQQRRRTGAAGRRSGTEQLSVCRIGFRRRTCGDDLQLDRHSQAEWTRSGSLPALPTGAHCRASHQPYCRPVALESRHGIRSCLFVTSPETTLIRRAERRARQSGNLDHHQPPSAAASTAALPCQLRE